MQFVWQPYGDITINAHIPDDALSERLLWITVSPLICFRVLEWHAADCVMHQFGFSQPIPLLPHILEGFHNKDLREIRTTVNWRVKHDGWVTMWEHIYQRILKGIPIDHYYPFAQY